MEHLDICKISVNLWRNTAGETREIYTSPPTKRDFYWRASIASITTSGGFSLFPGMERMVALLEGGETLLGGADRFNHTLKPFQPFAFATDQVVRAKLMARQMSMDFNIMTHLDIHKVKVEIIEYMFTTFDSRGRMVFVTNGAWRLGDKLLTTDQGVCWFDNKHTLWLLQPQSKLLFNETNWFAGHSPDRIQ